jgi:O-antigen ligase
VAWNAGFVAVGFLIYLFDERKASQSTQALTVTFGAMIGAAVRSTVVNKKRVAILLGILVEWLLIASLCQAASNKAFQYQGQLRWTGPWNNPNISGLLMGTGAVLIAGLGMRGWRIGNGENKMEDRGSIIVHERIFVRMLCLASALLMGRGLLYSYSRGAWLATGCGMAYLIAECRMRSAVFSNILWSKRNRLALSVALLSVVILFYGHLRQTDWHLPRRALSAVNPIDFSWRNRVDAWEGAFQITVEHPWLGAGWNEPERLYEHYYLPPKLTESAAIQMNDYLMLAATLGVPALFCFGMYLWQSLTRNAKLAKCGARSEECGSPFAEASDFAEATADVPEDEVRNESQDTAMPSSILHPPSSALLGATCRAGAIVLLVGFWFDGGLFKLATGSVFWILLELGNVPIFEAETKAET